MAPLVKVRSLSSVTKTILGATAQVKSMQFWEKYSVQTVSSLEWNYIPLLEQKWLLKT